MSQNRASDQRFPKKTKNGVYVPSPEPDTSLLIACLQKLHDNHPSVVVMSLNYDKDLHGYMIHFFEPDDSVVLERKYFEIGARRVLIYPLTTFLTVQNIPQNLSFDISEQLTKALAEKFGDILDIREIFQGWRIEVDIPENNTLRELYGVDLTVTLPQWHESFPVALWCRRCMDNGHLQYECSRDAACNSEDASRISTNNYSSSFMDTGLFDATPGTSSGNGITHLSPQKPASRVEDTSILSKRLQDYINEACNSCRVLDRKKLESFLVHVKKKSTPGAQRVALNFADNSEVLKELLKEIIQMYYNTLKTGTKEDTQFIIWLETLVKRID